MFPAACREVVKETGNKTLHPVSCLAEQSNVVPLHLVLKRKKRSWFVILTASYEPTEFQLNDILINPIAFNVKNKDYLDDFEIKNKHSLEGGIGAAEVVDLKLATNVSNNLSIKLGKLNKSEIEVNKLVPLLRGKPFNMDHPLIKEVRKDKRNVLCLITGVVSLAARGTISRVPYYEASVEGKFPGIVEVDAKGKIGGKRSVELTAGTSVAYIMHELNLATRQMEVTPVLTMGEEIGFGPSVDVPSLTSFELVRKESGDFRSERDPKKTGFNGFLSLPSTLRDEFRTLMFDLFKSTRDLLPLGSLLGEVVDGRYCKHCVSDLEKTLISSKQTWMRLLVIAGFTTDSKRSDIMFPPSEITDIVTDMEELFLAVTCIYDDELELISQCCAAVAPDILLVLKQGLRSVPVPRLEVPTLDKDEHGKKLLLQLHYSVESDAFTPPTHAPFTISEIYWTLFALWGQE